MPNLAKALKEEIQRLARKEAKTATAGLRKDSAALKHTMADQKRRIAKLERDSRPLIIEANKRRKEDMQLTDDEVQSARITAKMIRAIRAKLNLSQAELAKLLGVNSQTVYQWEHKQGRLSFRGNAKASIVAVRKLDRKEAQKRLAALEEKKPPKRKSKPKGK